MNLIKFISYIPKDSISLLLSTMSLSLSSLFLLMVSSYITNKNDGIANKNYFSKPDYDDTFEALWNELRSYNLAEHTLE